MLKSAWMRCGSLKTFLFNGKERKGWEGNGMELQQYEGRE